MWLFSSDFYQVAIYSDQTFTVGNNIRSSLNVRDLQFEIQSEPRIPRFVGSAVGHICFAVINCDVGEHSVMSFITWTLRQMALE
jgi:hypothetical protein